MGEKRNDDTMCCVNDSILVGILLDGFVSEKPGFFLAL